MMHFKLIIIGLLFTCNFTFARETVVKKITKDVITVTPGKNQLHTLGWPNDIINSIAVKTTKGIVLIDTQNSPANARLIKKKIIQTLNDSTFVYVVNTHGHSCHSGGNCIFEQDNIVAHTNSATEIKDYDDLFLGQTVDFLRKKIYHKTNILDTITATGVLSDSINKAIDLYKFYENDLINNYQARYPDITFDDTLTLTPGNKTIKLSYMGKGHGDADIVVYIKEDKVVCTGNLFHLGSYKEEAMPSFYKNRENDVEHWIETLAALLDDKNEIDYVISTHGKKPFERKNLQFILDYCTIVNEKIKAAKKSVIALEVLQNTELFEDFFKNNTNILRLNDTIKEMHAKNIAIAWKYIN
ncbi:MAG: MBL fold metallo-hydrolase [Prolixibacteraceae bacterium]|jgi:glyoxylase-like metal-dependent hydrolase (beta-lactamase superfamily II)|nr:MBL fold metallo-hydrolase [Prolixibacteraceae bacterium]